MSAKQGFSESELAISLYSDLITRHTKRGALATPFVKRMIYVLTPLILAGIFLSVFLGQIGEDYWDIPLRARVARSAALSGDGSEVIVVDHDDFHEDLAVLWDAVHHESVFQLAVPPIQECVWLNGNEILMISISGIVHILNKQTRDLTNILKSQNNFSYYKGGVSLSQNREKAAITRREGLTSIITLLALDSFEEAAKIELENVCDTLCFTASNEIWYNDGFVICYLNGTNGKPNVISNESSQPVKLIYLSERKQVLLVLENGSIKLWRQEEKDMQDSFQLSIEISSASHIPGTGKVVIGDYDGGVFICDLNAGHSLKKLWNHSRMVDFIDVANNGTAIVSVSDAGGLDAPEWILNLTRVRSTVRYAVLEE